VHACWHSGALVSRRESWRCIGGDELNWELEEIMLKKLSTLVAAGAFAVLLMPSANAMTVAPISAGSDVVQVGGGCGRGWHRNRFGRCVPRRHVICRSVHTRYGWRRVCR
jgi:hypothetical protein